MSSRYVKKVSQVYELVLFYWSSLVMCAWICENIWVDDMHFALQILLVIFAAVLLRVSLVAEYVVNFNEGKVIGEVVAIKWLFEGIRTLQVFEL